MWQAGPQVQNTKSLRTEETPASRFDSHVQVMVACFEPGWSAQADSSTGCADAHKAAMGSEGNCTQHVNNTDSMNT